MILLTQQFLIELTKEQHSVPHYTNSGVNIVKCYCIPFKSTSKRCKANTTALLTLLCEFTYKLIKI